MNQSDPIPLALAAEIDRVCDSFEAAWRGEGRPRLENYWSLKDEPGRSALLRELLRVEVEYRRGRGETPTFEEYRANFPGFEELLGPLFSQEPGLGSTGPTWVGDTGSFVPFGGATNGLGFVGPPGYELLEELGRGGMGVVYKARQVRLMRDVALKVIRGRGVPPEAVRRFEAEARTVALFDHPNIVRVYESGEHGGVAYLTLELLRGGSLARQLKGGPWPARRAAEMVACLAEAVEYAHRRGVVHRDLKPANVLLGEDGTPKIADFGLSRVLDSGAAQTRPGELVGTPVYMAPEQALGEKDVGPCGRVRAGRHPLRTADRPAAPAGEQPGRGAGTGPAGAGHAAAPREPWGACPTGAPLSRGPGR